MTAEGLVIRAATLADVDHLADHRAAMFRDMGRIAEAAYAPLVAATRAYLVEAMPRGEYVAWVAVPAADRDVVVGGAGIHLRPQIPRPDALDPTRIAAGLQGLVVNVYTDPAWRRRGVARLLMEAVIAYARQARLAALVLNASDDGRPLYVQLGFVATGTEMRYDRPLQGGGAGPEDDR